MLLSIGMIVKNEEKYLRKCLNGLKPILEHVHSELIICDTGSTDRSVEIAKEFTDNVYEIGWRQDFAWARNQSLNRSTGKWYMYVDADEIFEDSKSLEELISFFNTGEYKKYKTATYIMKNIVGIENRSKGTSTFRPIRLHKRTKELIWKSKIHEYLFPVARPTKDLDCISTHYGYYHESQEAREAKCDRNLTLLLEEYESDPDNLKTLFQTAQEYKILQNFEEVLKYTQKGIELSAKTPSNYYFHALYQAKLESTASMGSNEQVVEVSKEFFSRTPVHYANAFVFKYFELLSLQLLNRNEEARDTSLITLDLFDRYKSGELDQTILSCVTVPNVSRQDLLKYIVLTHAITGDFNTAKKWIEDKDCPKGMDVYKIFAERMLKNGTPNKIEALYAQAREFELGSEEYNSILNILEENLTNEKLRVEVAQSLVEQYSEYDSDYIKLQYLRCNGDEYTDKIEIAKHFLKSDTCYPQYYSDVIVSAIRHKLDFTNFLNNIRIKNISDFATPMIIFNKDFAEVIEGYLNEFKIIEECKSIKFARLMSCILLLLFQFKPNCKENASEEEKQEFNELTEKRKLFFYEAHTRMHHKYLSMVYREEIYNDDGILNLSEKDIFAYYLGCAYENIDNGDKVGFTKNLRLALKTLPENKDILSQIAKKLEKDLKEEVDRQANVKNELSAETAKIKEIIYTTLKSGDKATAAQILESYAQINPSDPDIANIMEMISNNI